MNSSLSHCRTNAFKVMSLTIAIGHGARFDIYDIATETQWVELVETGHAADVLTSAVDGAVESLHRFGATSADILSCPTVSPGGLVTEDDMRVAIGWLASALLSPATQPDRHRRIFGLLIGRGWWTDPARITSLVLAIAVAAGHGRDHDRG